MDETTTATYQPTDEEAADYEAYLEEKRTKEWEEMVASGEEDPEYVRYLRAQQRAKFIAATSGVVIEEDEDAAREDAAAALTTLAEALAVIAPRVRWQDAIDELQGILDGDPGPEDDYDDSMDGDHETALASVYGEDRSDYDDGGDW